MTSLALGLMSGTSLDGLDAALVRIGGRRDLLLEAFHTVAFDQSFRTAVRETLERGTPRELACLHADLGARQADVAAALLESARVPAGALAFVASHGLTAWHEPGRVSFQVGDPAVIAERLGVPVVSDFRSRDVAAGGQGAPLVPIADALLWGHPEHGRILLNVGGMANLTWVPEAGSLDGVIAFDTGPGVAVLDAVVRRETGEPFDRDGRLCADGDPAENVVDTLLAGPYFQRPPPKSTGRELFGDQAAADLIARVRAVRATATAADCAATAVALSCRAVRHAVHRWLPAPAQGDVVVSGGGVRNPHLLARLRAELDGWAVSPFDDLFFDGDAKEAAAFAYLGWLTLAGQTANVPSATGARGPRILGRVTPA